MTADTVVLENETCRIAVGRDGILRSFADLSRGEDRAVKGQPFMQIGRGGRVWPVAHVSAEGGLLTADFGESGVSVTVRAAVERRYFRLVLERVTGGPPDWVELIRLPLEITQNVGTLINAAWDERFAACVLALNDRTDSAGADPSRAFLTARAYRQYGLEGASVAVLGVPTGPPDPADHLLDAIEAVELKEGLPHPVLNGKWIKRAPERFASYLMAHDFSEATVDRLVDFARGGFGCIEIYPWQSTPSYRLNPQLFPGGMSGLKRAADKVHAAGLQLGLHSMQAMVGWGGYDDPYITPRADSRLLQTRHATLTGPLPPEATEIPVQESLTDWPESGDLFLEGEIVRYVRRTENAFTGCQRGLHGTTVGPHAAGTRAGLLANCFAMWGNTIYAPDVNSTMVDEVCDHIARVFNAVDCDMAYFDGGEEIAIQPPHWRNQGRVALGVMKRLKKPIILEGNALYTHLAWHVITRGSPSYDPIYYGRREYTLRAKGRNPAGWAKNLLTGDVGWFAPHTWSLSTDAVTPDEVMLLCLKALAGNAPISFQVSAGNLWANRRMPEMQRIIRACDDLKRRSYFPKSIRDELARPMAEHVLEQSSNGRWTVSPLQFGPPQAMNAAQPGRNTRDLHNPYPLQQPWVRIRARSRLAPYGSKENLVLADFSGDVPFRPDGSASPDLTQAAESAPDQAPDGAPAFLYRAENRAQTVSGWCKLALPFPKPLDLSRHRRLGLWVHAEGGGGILNVQLANTYGYRDHYIPLDFKGWAYRELEAPEDRRFYDYAWPYSFIDLFYWVFRYDQVTGVNLFYNGLPAGAETRCRIGRIEALAERSLPVRSPALEAGGQRIAFPVTLPPEDYLELDWDGRCRHFERNGALVEEVAPQGQLVLPTGGSAVRFTCESGETASPCAEVTFSLKGTPLTGSPARKAAAAGAKSSGRTPDRLTLHHDGQGRFRVTQGLYHLADAAPPHTFSPSDGTANVWQVENPRPEAVPAALLIVRSPAVPEADYDDPRALVLENFQNPGLYSLSERNRFEPFVEGEGKEVAGGGVVRAGVRQTLTLQREGERVRTVYAADNRAGSGGWCAVGRRFDRPADLSAFPALALRVRGDGKGEKLRVQLRDTAGRHADWVVPIDFSEWKTVILSFDSAEADPGFDRKQAAYLLFYFNDLPAESACGLTLEGLRALPWLKKPRPLTRPQVRVNDQRVTLPVSLPPGDAALLDADGSVSICSAGSLRARKTGKIAGRLLLRPGTNRIELAGEGSVTGMQVRLFRPSVSR